MPRPGFVFDPFNGCCVVDCTGCGEIVWEDDFSAVLGGYTDGGCPGTAPVWSVGSGILSVTNGGGTKASGSYYQEIPRPSGSRICITVSAECEWIDATCGFGVGDARNFFARKTGSTFAKTGNTSVVCGDGSGFTTFGSPSSGMNEMTMVINGSGGVYDILYCVAGVLLHEESGIALSLPDPLKIGVVCTNGGRWDNLVIRTN